MISPDGTVRLASSLLLAGALTAGCYRPISPSEDQIDFVELYRQKNDPFKPNRFVKEFPTDPNAPEAIVSKHTWVKVANNHPISHDNGTQKKGDSCSLQEGQKIKQVQEADANKRLLAIYQPDSSRAGAQCPNGTLFEMDKATFDNSTAEFNEREMKRRIEDQLVTDLLEAAKNKPSTETAVVQTIAKEDWVEIQGRREADFTRRECVILIGHQVELIGEDTASDRVLARYRSKPGEGGGTICANKSIFFLPKSEFMGMTADYLQNGARRIKEQQDLYRFVEAERRKRIVSKP